MDKDQKYFEVKNKYLAEALAFFNYKYYKFKDKETNRNVYSFEDTEEVKEMMKKLINMKNSLS